MTHLLWLALLALVLGIAGVVLVGAGVRAAWRARLALPSRSTEARTTDAPAASTAPARELVALPDPFPRDDAPSAREEVAQCATTDAEVPSRALVHVPEDARALVPRTRPPVHRPAAARPLAPFRPSPVVFVHGFAGFDEIRVGVLRESYFRGVRKRLLRLGIDARFVRVSPVAPIAVRAAQLAEQIGRMDAARVHVVAHSMGGLDARWAITRLGLDRRVASLLTVGTPHRGTPLADLGMHVLSRTGLLSRVHARIPLSRDAVRDLTTRRMEALNDELPDAPSVRYASVVVAPAHGALGVTPALLPTYLLLRAQAGDNDGVVPSRSQRWGEVLGAIDADHWGAVGWGRRFDAAGFYERIAVELALGRR